MLISPILSFLSIQSKSSRAAKRVEAGCDAEWIQHQNDDGMFYYEDTTNGTTTWLTPVDEDRIAWADQKPKSHAAKQFETEYDVQWIQHCDEVSGMFYYEDATTKTVTWMSPVGEECIEWAETQA